VGHDDNRGNLRSRHLLADRNLADIRAPILRAARRVEEYDCVCSGDERESADTVLHRRLEARTVTFQRRQRGLRAALGAAGDVHHARIFGLALEIDLVSPARRNGDFDRGIVRGTESNLVDHVAVRTKRIPFEVGLSEQSELGGRVADAECRRGRSECTNDDGRDKGTADKAAPNGGGIWIHGICDLLTGLV
jgi:hypothetical protein